MVSAEWFPPPPPPPPSVDTWFPIYFWGGESFAHRDALVRWGYWKMKWRKITVSGLTFLSNTDPNIFQDYAGSPLKVTDPAIVAALVAAGAGPSVVGINVLSPFQQEMAILFDSSVSPRIWFTSSVGGAAPVFTPATGLPAGNGISMAGGLDFNDALAAFAGPATRFAADGFTFGNNGVPPSQINKLLQEAGQGRTYLGAAVGGIVKTIDQGAIWGYVRPHAGLGTTWPALAVGRDVAFLPAPKPSPALAALYLLGNTLYRQLTADNTWETVDGAPPTTGGWMLRDFGGGIMAHLRDTTGTCTLRYSTDDGATWATRALPAGSNQGWSYDIGPDGRVWYVSSTGGADPSGRIHYSDDGGANWTLSNSFTYDTVIGHVAVNPANANQIAVSYTTVAGTTRVRVSTNHGASWTQRTPTSASIFLPAHGVASGRMHWLGSRLVFIGHYQDTHTRILYSDDFGVNWTQAFNAVTGGLIDTLSGGSFGPLFLLIDGGAGVGQFLRSTDHGVSWKSGDSAAGALVDPMGMAYDILGDRLFAVFDNATVYLIPNAGTRDMTTAAAFATGWTQVASPGVAVGPVGITGNSGGRLALITS